MNLLKTFIVIFIALIQIELVAQTTEYIITFNSTPSHVTSNQIEAQGFQLVKKIFDNPVMYLISPTNRNAHQNINKLNKLIDVAHISKNNMADLRTTEPNDARYEDQWHLDKIRASDAWDLATSGLTPQGDTIVLAIFDLGIEITHPDLRDNLWKNPGEIPNDEIDNDENGYVDDFIGVNLHSGKDDHFPKSHGTEVVGVMGASGNNEIGVAGVSWNSKLLPISKSQGSIFDSDMIESLNYIIQQRKLYNDSDGAKGAFVVAINISIGFLKASAADHPALCAALDELGAQGILAITATANEKFDVDVEGDVPAVCPSEFQIAVTGSQRSDDIMSDVAFGKQHIDIAAPGEDILTTALGRNYADRSGTSLATPQVAGAVALLYMAASDDLMTLVKSNPANGALLMRELILSNAAYNNDLNNKVASNGRLDLADAVQAANDYTADPVPDALRLFIITSPIEDNLDIKLDLPSKTAFEVFVFDTRGRMVANFSEQNPPNAGINPYAINIDNFAPGIYFITVIQGSERITKKFVKIIG